MEVIILGSEQEVCHLAARRIQKVTQALEKPVLGLATGSTPLKLYEKLVHYYQKGLVDFSKATSFNLDEYVGVSPEDHASYYSYMKTNFFSKVNFSKDKNFIPDGLATDVEKECHEYEKRIKEFGPIDIQILGIGRDGHIGFNEPGSSLSSRTRLKTLTQTTRDDNAPYFSSGQVPHHVITMGIGTIMEAKEVVLIAFGQKKAEAIAALVEGPVTASVPASALQFHPCVKVIIDSDAASQLKRKEYYQWVYEQKPAWQRQRDFS